MNILLSPYLFTGTAALLLIATFDLPYFFYDILRLVACAAFSWLSFLNHVYDEEPLYLILGIISVSFAVIFNPFVPFYLDKETWITLDVISALFIFANGIVVTNKISN